MSINRREMFASVAALVAGAPVRAQTKQREEFHQLLSIYDFEAEAEKRVSHGAWARIQGGAADEITLRWNKEAYQHIRLRPGVLVDVSKLDTRVRLFGQEMPFPILLSPTGAQ